MNSRRCSISILCFLIFLSVLGRSADEGAAGKLTMIDRAIMQGVGSNSMTYGRYEVGPLHSLVSHSFIQGAGRDLLRTALAAVHALSDAEISRCPAAQRALVQNRVWTVFDHIVRRQKRHDENRALLQALANVMAKLALTARERDSMEDPLQKAMTGGKFPVAPGGEGGPAIF